MSKSLFMQVVKGESGTEAGLSSLTAPRETCVAREVVKAAPTRAQSVYRRGIFPRRGCALDLGEGVVEVGD